MNKKLQSGRFRIVSSMLGLCIVIGIVLSFSGQASSNDFAEPAAGAKGETGTVEKMIVASGNVAMDLDLNRLNGTNSSARTATLSFAAVPDTFFKILVFNGEFRSSLPSSMELTAQNSAALPASLNASHRQLVIESTPWGGQYELLVRDGKTGFTFFNIEGQQYGYNADRHSLSIET